MSSAHDVYVLTDITRKAAEQRRVVVSGFDIRWRTAAICIAGAIPGVFLTGIMWIFVHEYSIVMIPLTIGALFVLVDSKSKSGLHLPMWKMLLDRKRSSVGKFFMCGVEIDPLATPVVLCVQSTVPVERDDRALSEQALGIG